jgi:biopolymer transport protein ExbD
MAASTSSYSDDSGPITEINVTPLVDVVLVLLIMFMITVPTIIAPELLRERELSIQLPEASEARPLTAPAESLIVNIEADGRYKVSEAHKTQAELAGVLAQARADNPGRLSVLIRADKKCPWQFVVSVVNLCTQAHIPFSVTAMTTADK